MLSSSPESGSHEVICWFIMTHYKSTLYFVLNKYNMFLYYYNYLYECSLTYGAKNLRAVVLFTSVHCIALYRGRSSLLEEPISCNLFIACFATVDLATCSYTASLYHIA